ncbi:MAG: cupredoxin domain-containing protein [Rhodospirillales bacterium]|nr:cupredoxin domain-containing protein [Alphaproteobacteria bacterium]MBL6947192.1 cupredoxin domain-containing protein [Rhodospirillales bacterium]
MTRFSIWRARTGPVGVFVVLALACALLAVAAGTPVTAYAASISGEIKVDGGKKLKNMIVFLEPADKKAAEAVKKHKVTQKGRIFSPAVTVVVAGSEVVFVNDEEREIDHNVYSLSRTRKFDIGLASKNSKLTVDFPKAGTVKYYCSVHKNMEGTIIVVPSPFYALMEKPGAFTLDNVPEGQWKLNAAVSHRRYSATPVAVAVSGSPVDSVSLTVSRKRKKRR